MSIVLLATALQSFGQEMTDYRMTVAKSDVPTPILKAVEADFPGARLVEFAAIPLDYVDGEVFLDKIGAPSDAYDTFAITLDSKGREFTAEYQRDGKLISTMEQLKNVTPPPAVRNAVEKAYPGWEITKDSYSMVHHRDGKKKERYRLVLAKNRQKVKVYTDAKGKILNKPKKAK